MESDSAVLTGSDINESVTSGMASSAYDDDRIQEILEKQKIRSTKIRLRRISRQVASAAAERIRVRMKKEEEAELMERAEIWRQTLQEINNSSAGNLTTDFLRTVEELRENGIVRDDHEFEVIPTVAERELPPQEIDVEKEGYKLEDNSFPRALQRLLALPLYEPEQYSNTGVYEQQAHGPPTSHEAAIKDRLENLCEEVRQAQDVYKVLKDSTPYPGDELPAASIPGLSTPLGAVCMCDMQVQDVSKLSIVRESAAVDRLGEVGESVADLASSTDLSAIEGLQKLQDDLRMIATLVDCTAGLEQHLEALRLRLELSEATENAQDIQWRVAEATYDELQLELKQHEDGVLRDVAQEMFATTTQNSVKHAYADLLGESQLTSLCLAAPPLAAMVDNVMQIERMFLALNTGIEETSLMLRDGCTRSASLC